MIGINNIGIFIPNNRISNDEKCAKFECDINFLQERIGVSKISRKENNIKTSDLCVRAFNNLQQKENIELGKIDLVVVVTQNPDTKIPHTASIVAYKIGLNNKAPLACFDISLGCSGYPYALRIVKSFMEDNNLETGLLFTADPYSEVVSDDDKNTSLLFGDAATVTLLTNSPKWKIGKFTFGTLPQNFMDLNTFGEHLEMNGRSIFNFAATHVPKDIKTAQELNNINNEEVDLYLFHQGSKFIVDTLIRRIGLPAEKVPFDIQEYGNTVSSSLPILLEKHLTRSDLKNILISGFGVGLSHSTGFITRIGASHD